MSLIYPNYFRQMRRTLQWKSHTVLLSSMLPRMSFLCQSRMLFTNSLDWKTNRDLTDLVSPWEIWGFVIQGGAQSSSFHLEVLKCNRFVSQEGGPVAATGHSGKIESLSLLRWYRVFRGVWLSLLAYRFLSYRKLEYLFWSTLHYTFALDLVWTRKKYLLFERTIFIFFYK